MEWVAGAVLNLAQFLQDFNLAFIPSALADLEVQFQPQLLLSLLKYNNRSQS